MGWRSQKGGTALTRLLALDVRPGSRWPPWSAWFYSTADAASRPDPGSGFTIGLGRARLFPAGRRPVAEEWIHAADPAVQAATCKTGGRFSRIRR